MECGGKKCVWHRKGESNRASTTWVVHRAEGGLEGGRAVPVFCFAFFSRCRLKDEAAFRSPCKRSEATLRRLRPVATPHISERMGVPADPTCSGRGAGYSCLSRRLSRSRIPGDVRCHSQRQRRLRHRCARVSFRRRALASQVWNGVAPTRCLSQATQLAATLPRGCSVHVARVAGARGQHGQLCRGDWWRAPSASCMTWETPNPLTQGLGAYEAAANCPSTACVSHTSETPDASTRCLGA